uniref:Uncharacterized protein n=1 Tax=Cacopsylla melanoneura TaxID=428564 RepID=A0A8D8VTV2_9HEMI
MLYETRHPPHSIKILFLVCYSSRIFMSFLYVHRNHIMPLSSWSSSYNTVFLLLYLFYCLTKLIKGLVLPALSSYCGENNIPCLSWVLNPRPLDYQSEVLTH